MSNWIVCCCQAVHSLNSVLHSNPEMVFCVNNLNPFSFVLIMLNCCPCFNWLGLNSKRNLLHSWNGSTNCITWYQRLLIGYWYVTIRKQNENDVTRWSCGKGKMGVWCCLPAPIGMVYSQHDRNINDWRIWTCTVTCYCKQWWFRSTSFLADAYLHKNTGLKRTKKK